MIDAKIADKLMGRLSRLNWFPREDTTDLMSALQAANNEAIAMYIVNDWIEKNPDAPKPAELRSAIWAENDRTKPDPLVETEKHWEAERNGEGSCRKCRGYGITESIHVENMRSIARYCDCEAGKARRYADCSEAKCRAQDEAQAATIPVRVCCAAPWKVNEARRKLLVVEAKRIAPISRARRSPGSMEKLAAVIGEEYNGDF